MRSDLASLLTTCLVAGATIGGGGSVAYLRNSHGVVIKVTSTSAGLDFQLSSNGVSISLG